MESVDTGQLLHKKEFTGAKDPIGLAMQLSALMQVAECQIKALQGDVLTCFSKDSNSSLAIAAEYTPWLCTPEQGQQVTDAIFTSYLEKHSSVIRTRNRFSNFKEFEASLSTIFRNTVRECLQELCKGLEVSKLLLLVRKSSRKKSMTLSEERRAEFFSGVTSAYSSISAESSFIESRSFRSFSVDPKVKYSFRPDSRMTNSPEERNVMTITLDEDHEFNHTQTKALMELCTSSEMSLGSDTPDKIDLQLPCGEVKVLYFTGVQLLMLTTGGTLRADWTLEIEKLARWAAVLFAVSK